MNVKRRHQEKIRNSDKFIVTPINAKIDAYIYAPREKYLHEKQIYDRRRPRSSCLTLGSIYARLSLCFSV